MAGIHRHRSEQRVQLLLAIFVDEAAGFGVQLVQGEHSNSVLGQRGAQRIPALVLIINERVSKARQNLALLRQRQSIGAGFVVAVLDLLHHGGHANLEKLVQIVGGDGQELQPLQKRVAFILGFFEHTAVEREPGSISVEIVLWILQRNASHLRGSYAFMPAILLLVFSFCGREICKRLV